MKQLNHARKPLTPERSLAKQLSWLPEKNESFPKSPNSSLTIALIAGERVYWSMQHEGKILSLTEANWPWVFKYGGVDLLLIESCAETATGDWVMAQTAPDLESSVFGIMVKAARQRNIPVAYWFTLDEDYLPQFQSAIEWMGGAFCADDRVVESLKEQSIQASCLPPAVQPALFTKLNQYTPEKRELKRLVCDDLADVIQSWEGRERFYQDVQEFGGYFYDSRNQVWNTKTKKLELKPERLLGTVDLHSRAALFKEARTLGILKSASRTRTDMKWSVVEAAASHMTILLEAGVDVGEFAALCLLPGNQDQFFVELIRHDKDNLYYERVAQKAWREALMKHTYSHRLRTICQQLGLKHGWVEYPSAAMVTPSYRKKFLERAKESFTRQTYPNKHWVMVFNGPKDEFAGIKTEVEKVENSQVTYVPAELHAGPCMNAGIQAAPVEYVFRMDDDDYYGENYLLDMMLNRSMIDFDVIGKVFRYFYMEDLNRDVFFRRTAVRLNFNKPSFCLAGESPEKMSYIAGCTHGGLRSFISKNPYPNKNFGSVDTQWLDSIREKGLGTVVCADDFNVIVDRRGAGDHTWNVNMEQMVRQSIELSLYQRKVVFV
jgi:hypothetical protein